MTSSAGGRLVSEMEKTFAERARLQPMVARCALCPDWRPPAGTAGELIELQQEHRRDVHGIKSVRRSRGRGGAPVGRLPVRSAGLSLEERQEIDREIERRRYLNGLDEEER